jgi:hypothetical protein
MDMFLYVIVNHVIVNHVIVNRPQNIIFMFDLIYQISIYLLKMCFFLRRTTE